MTFTMLWYRIRSLYREQGRAFHVLAARYYLGLDNAATLRALEHISGNRILTDAQVDAIITADFDDVNPCEPTS